MFLLDSMDAGRVHWVKDALSRLGTAATLFEENEATQLGMYQIQRPPGGKEVTLTRLCRSGQFGIREWQQLIASGVIRAQEEASQVQDTKKVGESPHAQ